MKCAWCEKPIRFWQPRVRDVGGFEHKVCWHKRWEWILEKTPIREMLDVYDAYTLGFMPTELSYRLIDGFLEGKEYA